MHIVLDIIGDWVIAAAVLTSVIALWAIAPRPHRLKRRARS